MSDVVLVYPTVGTDTEGVSVTLPLAVLSVASTVVGEFNVKIIDQRIGSDWCEQLMAELRSRPLCVGISCLTGSQIYHALRVAKVVKENAPDVPVVWGGMHPTLAVETTITHPMVDYAIQGEGEIAFRDFVRALADKQGLEKVAGLSWKQDGQIRSNPEGDPLDLDDLPKLPYHRVNVEAYVSPNHYLYPGVSRLLPFQGTRGCPFKCTFCSEPALTKRYRMMDPRRLHENVLELVHRYNLDHITFYDEEFFVNPRWAMKVAELINGEFTWWAQTRANDLLRVDLKKLEKCGMLITAPGLESGSNRILKFIKKQETVEEYLEVNRRLAATKIIPQYNFIIGYPTETRDEVYETVDLALRLIEENPNAVVNSFSPLTPLPGTEMLRVAAEHGFTIPETLEGWIAITKHRLPTPWQRRERELIENLMYTSYFVAGTAERWANAWPWVPRALVSLYGALVRRRWRRRKFKTSLDIRLLRLLHRHFNPVDFMTQRPGTMTLLQD